MVRIILSIVFLIWSVSVFCVQSLQCNVGLTLHAEANAGNDGLLVVTWHAFSYNIL